MGFMSKKGMPIAREVKYEASKQRADLHVDGAGPHSQVVEIKVQVARAQPEQVIQDFIDDFNKVRKFNASAKYILVVADKDVLEKLVYDRCPPDFEFDFATKLFGGAYPECAVMLAR